MTGLALLPPSTQAAWGLVTDPGVSATSSTQQNLWGEAGRHFAFPVSRRTLGERFADLAATWRAETRLCSSATEIVLDSSYQRIIAMGEPVIPLILSELEERADHWSWALAMLSGANPVPRDAEGDLHAMRMAWLAWGRAEGLID